MYRLATHTLKLLSFRQSVVSARSLRGPQRAPLLRLLGCSHSGPMTERSDGMGNVRASSDRGICQQQGTLINRVGPKKLIRRPKVPWFSNYQLTKLLCPSLL